MATAEVQASGRDLMRLPEAVLVPHAKIEPDPKQPREVFDEKELREMADTISKHGLQRPIDVRDHPEKDGWYMLVAGERRWRSCGILGLQEIAAFILDPDEDFLLIQFLENCHRVNLTPMEEARAYARMRDERGWNQNEIAQFVSKSPPHVSSRLQLLRLPEVLQKRVASKTLKVTVAGEILRSCANHFEMIELVNDMLAQTKSYGSIGIRTVQAAVARRGRRAIKESSRQKDDSANKNGIPLRQAASSLLGELEKIAGKQGQPYPPIKSVQAKWLVMPEARRKMILNYLEQIRSRVALLNQFLNQLGIDDDPYDGDWESD